MRFLVLVLILASLSACSSIKGLGFNNTFGAYHSPYGQGMVTPQNYNKYSGNLYFPNVTLPLQ